MVWKTSRAPRVVVEEFGALKKAKLMLIAGAAGIICGALLTFDVRRRLRRRRYRQLAGQLKPVQELATMEQVATGASGRCRVVAGPSLKATPGVNLRVLHLELPANSRTRTESLAEAVVLYVVLEGSGTLRRGDEDADLSPNSAAYVAPNLPHTVMNRSSAKLVLLQIVDPACAAPSVATRAGAGVIVPLEEEERQGFSILRSVQQAAQAAQGLLDADRA